MFDKAMKSTNGGKYISCIKINGVPILPPLLTHSKRKEMHKYKQQAIKLEKRVKRERDLVRYIHNHYTSSLNNYANPLITNTIEHELAFDNEINQTNGAKNISQTILPRNEVPSVAQKKAAELSCDLQVSQYMNNEFSVLTSFEKYNSDVEIDKSPYNEHSLSIGNSLQTKTDISDENNQRPRLIRSNSYILETPSPMLLEHLIKQSKFHDTVTNEFTTPLQKLHIENTNSSGKKLLFCDALSVKDHDYHVTCQEYDCSPNDPYSTDNSISESELKNMSRFSNDITSNDDVTIMENQYHLKEFIDNNVPQMIECDILTNTEIECDNSNSPIEYLCHSTNESSLIYNNECLMKILDNIPEMYSKQIVEFLDKQREDIYINPTYSSVSSTILENQPSVIRDDCCSVPQNQNADVFLNNSENVHTTPEPVSLCNTLNYNEACEKVNKSVLSCSRELFPSYDETEKQQFKEECAATIIGAAARGYLTRRLMRTERVQGLIQTIRDALICAMQLHSENIDNINELDVELHRRLIQQVSAACFEFHEVFFSMGTPEQMIVIKLDRERQKEKLKRPLSRTSSAGKSSSSKTLISR